MSDLMSQLLTPIYRLLALFVAQKPAPEAPRRILLMHPCCIGDVVLATPTLRALRKAYPAAHITWAVGGWSRQVVAEHPDLDALLDTGPAANPAQGLRGLLRTIRLLRAGRFDLAVCLVRSPWMSLAMLFSGIPHRAGLDSGGRGFAYNVRARVDPNQPRHEAEIYLDVLRALGIDPGQVYVNVAASEASRAQANERLAALGLSQPLLLIHPGGGRNPGMTLDAKRWPPQNFAALADALAEKLGLPVLLLGGPDDGDLVEALRSAMRGRASSLLGPSFGEVVALAESARLYVGNDTGMTHLAAAAGAPTVMILGPSDPARYAPFAERALALWQPVDLRAGGVAAGGPDDWDWARDGISVQAAIPAVLAFVDADL